MNRANEPDRGAEMPSRTPSRSDFARPTFVLGRISMDSSFTSSDDESSRKRRPLSGPPSAGSGTEKPLQVYSAGSYNVPVDRTPCTNERLDDSYYRTQPQCSSNPSSPFDEARHWDTRRLSAGSNSSRAHANRHWRSLPEDRRHSPPNWRGTGAAAEDSGRGPSSGTAAFGARGCDRENVSPVIYRYAGSSSGTPFPKPDPMSSESRPSQRSYHRRSPLGHAQEHRDGRGEDVSPVMYRSAGSGTSLPKPDPMSSESRPSQRSYNRRSPLGHAQEHRDGRGENVSPVMYRSAGSGTPLPKPDPMSSESRPSQRFYHRRSPLGHAQEHRDGRGEDVSPAMYRYAGSGSSTPIPQPDPMSPESWQSYYPQRSPADHTQDLSDRRESDGSYKHRKQPSPTRAAAAAIERRVSRGGIPHGSPVDTPTSRAMLGSSLPASPWRGDVADWTTYSPASTSRYRERNQSAVISVSGNNSTRSRSNAYTQAMQQTGSPGIYGLDIHSPRSMHPNMDRWGADPHGRVSLGAGGHGSGTTGHPANRGRMPSSRCSSSGGDDTDGAGGGGNNRSDGETSAGNADARSDDGNSSSASITGASPPSDEEDVTSVDDSKNQSRMGGRGYGQREPGEWEEEAGGLRWKMEAGKEENCKTSSKLMATATESDKPRAFSVPADLYKRMYPHQREGVRWLWGLHQGDMGGILGDDMGMGKTFQVTAFLAGLFSTEQATCALVLAPKSVMRSWETELRDWLVKTAPTVQVSEVLQEVSPTVCVKDARDLGLYQGNNPHTLSSGASVLVLTPGMSALGRKRMILGAMKGGDMSEGAVVVTSYGLVSAKPELFAPLGNELKWDYVVLDEGHKIKNRSTRTCKAVHHVPAWRRLILTGTPIQNNMEELYTVVDWVTFGGLFRTRNYFKDTFSRPIEGGQDRDASERTVLKSRARAAELRQLLAPYLLQRNKNMIMDRSKITKTEMVVWVALSRKQRQDYAAYLGGESVLDVLSGKISSPLAAIQALKKITLHTMLASYPLGRPWRLESHHTVDKLVKDSSKLAVVLEIVANARENGHRVLVFSRFVRMLDILERCIGEPKAVGGLGLKMARIDGSHSDVERKDTIAKFNVDESIAVCLVSTGAGGTGITLTGADRVIIFDPSWNPADDMQAVDRAYRIGQTRDVVVYRMIAAGTVEEKMYEKQIFKDGLRKTIMGGSSKRKKNVRYFSRAELKELFTLFPPGTCRVLEQLASMHGSLRGRLEAAESPIQRNISYGGHLDFLCGLVGSYGASAHDDFLPKVIQPNAAIATGGGGGGGSRPASRSRPIIAEEEDESEVELDADDDGCEHGAGTDFDLSEYYDDLGEAAPRPRTKVYAGSAEKSRRFSGGDGKGDVSEGYGSDGVGNDSVVEADRSDSETGSDKDSDSGDEGDGGRDVFSAEGGRDGDVDEVKDSVAETEHFWSETVRFDGEGDDDVSSADDFAIEVAPPASSIGCGGSKNDYRNKEVRGNNERVLPDADLFHPGGTGDRVERDTEKGGFVENDQPWSEKLDDMGRKDLGVGTGVVPQSTGDDPSRGIVRDAVNPVVIKGIAPRSGDDCGSRGDSRLCGDGYDFGKTDDEVQSKAESMVSEARNESCQEGDNAQMAIVIDSDSGSDHDFDIELSRRNRRFDAPSPGGHLKTECPVDDPVGSQPVLPPAATVATSTDRGDNSGSPRTWKTCPIPSVLSSLLRDGDGSGRAKRSVASELGGSNTSTISTPQHCIGSAERGVEKLISGKEEPGENTSCLDSSSPTMTPVTGGANRSGAASDAPSGKARKTGEAKERARQWANDILGISPAVSASSCGENEGGVQGGSLADEKTSRVSAGRESARIFAKKKLVINARGHSEEDDASMTREDEPDEGVPGKEQRVSDGSNYRSRSLVHGEGSPSGGRWKSPNASLASKEAIVEEREARVGPAATPDALVPAPAASTDETGVSTMKESVCATHKKLAKISGFKCFRCRCIVGAEAAEKAQILLLSAWAHERNGEPFDVIVDCMKALELCDEDRELHKTIKRIGTRIGAF